MIKTKQKDIKKIKKLVENFKTNLVPPYRVLLIVHTLPRTTTPIKPIHSNHLDNNQLPLMRQYQPEYFPAITYNHQR